MSEPEKRYALVQSPSSGNTYLLSDSTVVNGWHDITEGFGTDLTWGEVLHFDPDVRVLFEGSSDD